MYGPEIHRLGTAIGRSIAATAIANSAKLIAATAIAIFTKIDSRYRYRYFLKLATIFPLFYR